jgi:hypothetical protein
MYRPPLHTSGLLRAGAALVLLSLSATAASASSGAFAVQAQLTVDGVRTDYGPDASVSGGTTGPYDNKVVVAHQNDTIALYAVNPTPTLFVDARDMASEAKASGIEVDSSSASGAANLGSLALTLNLNPPPPVSTLPVPQPFLTVMGRGVHGTAQVDQVVLGPVTGFGDAGYDSLTLSGAVIGGAKLHFLGKPKPNTVIYSTANVTITLNKQTKVGIINCTPPTTCAFSLLGVTTEAVDVSLNHANWYGHIVSGDIAIGEAHAEMP